MVSKRRNPIARRRAIERALTASGALSVEELCQKFGASSATIRRDLAVLEREDLIERGFGGAAIRAQRLAEQVFAVREEQDVEAKKVIAAAALRLIEPGSTIFMNDGSTVMNVAREIIAAGIEVFVATPAVNVAMMLSEGASTTVCLLGGFLGRSSLATSGPFAEAMIDQINADLAVISVDGFNMRQGITFSNALDAVIARKMIERARRTAVLVTSAKFQILGRYSAVAGADTNVLISESIDAVLAGSMRAVGIEVIEADLSFEERRLHA
jgi:DeoR/GlpR family transcriptional regulator of sugar metabolism